MSFGLSTDLHAGDEYRVPDPRDPSRRVRAELVCYSGPDRARIGWFRIYGEAKGFLVEAPVAQCERVGAPRPGASEAAEAGEAAA